jgi:hypothetical protein
MTQIDPWAVLDDTVLRAFTDDTPRAVSDVLRTLPDLTVREIRTALHVNAERGFLRSARGAVHTHYTITPAGRKHLAGARTAVA